MSTFKELVYMVMDELKLHSDDAVYTEDHVLFLLNKYRAFLLKQKYSDIRRQIPESNYQTLKFDLVENTPVIGDFFLDNSYLVSTKELPFLLPVGTVSVYPLNYYKEEITLISKDRMKYVGNTRYLRNIIYASIGPDNYLYFKSTNIQHLYLSNVKVTGVFEDPIAVYNEQGITDVLDVKFPLEDALVPPLIELVVKELLGALYRPEDTENNAKDDLSEVTIQKS